jgi:hypothetical protein
MMAALLLGLMIATGISRIPQSNGQGQHGFVLGLKRGKS